MRTTATAFCSILAVSAAFLTISCGGKSEQTSGAFSLQTVRVANSEPTRVVVIWTTTQPSQGEVRYGTDSLALDRVVSAKALTTIHTMSIEGLEDSTTYYFRVTARSAQGGQVTGSVVEAATPGRSQASASLQQPGYEVAVISTRFGEIVFRFHELEAPRHTDNFKRLARAGFYDGTTFHRVIPGFIIQGGDPLSKDADRSNDGSGGPGYTLPAEIYHPIARGSVAAARQPDILNPQRRSSGSQFLIAVAPLKALDGRYTVFGEVLRGMNVVNRIVNLPADKNNNPIDPIPMKVTIKRVLPGQWP